MKIAEVSKRYDISSDTLRYYERVGLLRPVPRMPNGVRNYEEADCQRIEFVKCMRKAGVSIEALIEYLRLFEEGDSSIEQRKAILEEQYNLIQQRIAAMQEGLDRLAGKIATYDTSMLSVERRMRQAEEARQG